mgnify:CR=1 FL=1
MLFAAALLLCVGTAPAGTSLRAPLKSVYWCNTSDFASTDPCGPAVPNRTVFNNDLCRSFRTGTGLLNMTLDIATAYKDDGNFNAMILYTV